MLQGALDAYKVDNGSYPQDSASTDKLSPKTHFDPSSPEYAKASLRLYQDLTGDAKGANGAAAPDGVPDNGTPIYLKEFDPRILAADRDPKTKNLTAVKGFQDPWGNMYGYSTAALAEEIKYQEKLRKGEKAERLAGEKNPGYNIATPDLWSTGGAKLDAASATPEAREAATKAWLKNW